jgi:mannose/fructose/N-acetylgalactosamine-specific phosphotransferase system component IIC
MNLVQAILIALLGYLTYIHVPFLGGGLVGWYCIGRPLVSALFIGLILNDVKTAMILGVEVQLIFIGLVTPGGSITPDMNLATYVAIPLGVVTGLDKGATVALAVTVASVANVMAAPCYAATLLPVNYQKKLVAEGKLKEAAMVPVWGNVVKFLFRFIPTFVLCYYGQTAISTILAVCPTWVIELLTVFGNPMCLVGFAILMKLMVKRPTDLLFYTFGFALTSVVPNGNMVTVLIFGLVLAFLRFEICRAGKKVA